MRLPSPACAAQRRAAISAVETLVVLAIIGTSFALLAAGIVKIRETANRAACQNNMHQVGLALQHYVSDHGNLPPGTTNETLPFGGPRTTWAVNLLPYLQEGEVYQKIDLQAPPTPGPFTAASATAAPGGSVLAGNANSTGADAPTRVTVPTFLCPSDGTGRRTADLSFGSYSFSNYLGFFGDIRYGAGLPGANPANRRAAFGLNFGASFSDITDGTSNTMIVGEYLRGLPDAATDLRGWFWNDQPGYSQLYTQLPPNSRDGDLLEPGHCNNRPELGLPCDEAAGALNETAGARSRHPGGVNVLMADGAVRFVSDTIDLTTWQNLATIAGDDDPDQSAAPPAQVAAQPPANGIVPNQYIIAFNDSVTDPKATAAQMAAAGGFSVGHVYHAALRGFSAYITNKSTVQALGKDPRVRYVSPDKVFKTCVQTVPTGVRRIFAPQSHAHPGVGSGKLNITVAILDTGIDDAHPDLNVVFSKGFGYATGRDGNGHGTHVAGITAARDNSIGVVGVAKGANLWAIKVLSDQGSGFASDVIAGMNYVAAHSDQVHVVNMSLGGSFDQPTNDAVDALVDKGVFVAVAAGNSAADASLFSPASAASAMCVAALCDTDGLPGGLGPKGSFGDKDDTFASFSNFGEPVTVIAPGEDILSCWKGGGYRTISGTSMASPHVAGLAALIMSTKIADGSAHRAFGFRAVRDRSLVNDVRNAIMNTTTENIPGLAANGDPFVYPLINASSF